MKTDLIPPQEQLCFEYGQKKVEDFVVYFEKGSLKLDPPFQRQSVWSQHDQQKLIDSIFQNYPLPAIFLYEHPDSDGNTVYEVIDGKQRLEAILTFMKKLWGRGSYSVKFRMEGDGEPALWNWSKINRYHLQSKLLNYPLPTVTVRGPLSSIIDLFVRINSTGKKLTSAEKRNAKFYNSIFLKIAVALASREDGFGPYGVFKRLGIFSANDIARMKNVEFVSELLASIYQGGELLDKKRAIDGIMAGELKGSARLLRAKKEVIKLLGLVRKIFPELKTTRFSNSPEFYSLCMFVYQMQKDRRILNSRLANNKAMKMLKRLSNEVGEFRERQRYNQSTRGFETAAEYVQTVQGSTDNLGQRRRRQAFFENNLGILFHRMDMKRTYSPEERRFLWNNAKSHRCAICHAPLSWENFTIDHIKAYSRGGRTTLANARIVCRSCNSRKGAR